MLSPTQFVLTVSLLQQQSFSQQCGLASIQRISLRSNALRSLVEFGTQHVQYTAEVWTAYIQENSAFVHFSSIKQQHPELIV